MVSATENLLDQMRSDAVRCFKANINNLKGAIVLPIRSHYSSVLEFISKDYLREKLNLNDGDFIEVTIYFEE